MSDELKGKVAVITGGGRGLGRATALEMARAGAKIVVADLYRDDSGAAADTVVREVEHLGGEATAACEDVSTMAGAQRIAAAGLEKFGRIDALCTYVGNFVYQGIEELTPHMFESSIAVHLGGTFNCIKAVLPAMLSQNSGRILTVSSRAAYSPAVPAYTAAKTAIISLTAAVAGEMAAKGTGITANCLIPSAYTQLFPTQAMHPPLLAAMPTPEPETLDPADVAPLAAFLATDEARNITGRFFFAGGGDVFLFAPPFAITTMSNLVRKEGRWTIAELAGIVGPIINQK
jgi:NAD(P)-dependent dehydrogenase (short-subunit alcohol dehydrogenase family)